jgi:hypothetical protein
VGPADASGIFEAGFPGDPDTEARLEDEFDWVNQWIDVVRATRGWIQYGMVGFAILCIVIGAVEALFGR